jgi:putative beta-lysine N-acetyltransferase
MFDTFDKIEDFEGGVIHHGKNSNRIYGMHLPLQNLVDFLESVEALAVQKGYEKLFMKTPASQKEILLQKGYIEEATIPCFYTQKDAPQATKEDGFFMVKYLSVERAKKMHEKEIEDVLSMAMQKKEINVVGESKTARPLESSYTIRKIGAKDIPKATTLYKKVFKTYPFPIFEQTYIAQTMKENVVYFGIWEKEKLIALSSSEMDIKNKNAEMTDFAVDPSYRGQNLALFLLNKMEEEMKKRGVEVVYTIARALSYGMNATFAKSGYTFSGTLYNNTQIADSIESMNVWYKISVDKM